MVSASGQNTHLTHPVAMQRDPGEFLLELQGFASIPSEPLRRAAIDVHLEAYDSAIRHYIQAATGPAPPPSQLSSSITSEPPSQDTVASQGEDKTPHHSPYFVQALNVARQHGLLRSLLSLLKDDHLADMRRAVHAALGDDLESRNRHEDAALAYVAAGDGEKALRSYRLAGQWRPAMTLAVRLGRDAAACAAIAKRLAADLEDAHRHGEAATLVLEHLQDVPEAVRLLCGGGEWRRALHACYSRGFPRLVDAAIAPAAAAAAIRVLSTTSEDKERVEKYRRRLSDLRAKREAMAKAIEAANEHSAAAAGGGGYSHRDLDMFDDVASEAPSVVSGLSAYTLGTTATGASGVSGSGASALTLGGRRAGKKKQQKKKKSKKIRQGSPEEEAELGRLLLSLAPQPSLCTEVGELEELLVMLGHEEDAAKLQNGLKELIDAQQDAVRELIEHPPPGMGLHLGADMDGCGAIRTANLGGGMVAVAAEALEGVLSNVAGPDLRARAAESEALLKGVHWKWEVLRGPAGGN
jgi:elongator complex protein 1